MEGRTGAHQPDSWRQHMEDERERQVLVELRKINSSLRRLFFLVVAVAGTSLPSGIESLITVAGDEVQDSHIGNPGENR